jgi:hypothetical protein
LKSNQPAHSDTHFEVPSNTRHAFALAYTINPSSLSLSISSFQKPIQIFNHDLIANSTEHEEIIIKVKTGDTDGANLPWFDPVDPVLLYWWIHHENIKIPLLISRSVDSELEISTFEIRLTDQGKEAEPLLSIQLHENHIISATVPRTPHSSSPSSTYPIRVLILHIIVPTALLFIATSYLIVLALRNLLTVTFYGFFVFGVLVAFWKCIRGPRVMEKVEKAQERLEIWRGNRWLWWLPLESVRRRIDHFYPWPRRQEGAGDGYPKVLTKDQSAI